jgi:hypothetical protein
LERIVAAIKEAILIGGILPCALAAICTGLGLWLGRGQVDRKWPQAGATCGSGLGFCVGYFFFHWTVLVPEESWHWLLYLALGAMLCGVLTPWLRWSLRAILVLGLACAAGYLLVPDFEELAPEKMTWQFLLGSSIFGMWLILDAVLRQRPTVHWGLCFLLTLLAVSLAMAFLPILKFMQLAGLVVAPFAVLAFLEGKARWRGLAWGVVPLFALIVPGLLLLGKFNSDSELPLQPYLWLMSAPLGFALVQLLPERHWRSMAAYAVLLGCLGTGLGMAWNAVDGFSNILNLL